MRLSEGEKLDIEGHLGADVVASQTGRRRDEDQIFEHKMEPEGEYVLEMNNEIVATGGFLTHYNKPFADLYMEVKKDQRRKGMGSFLLQEVKKECYRRGHVPAARCDIKNRASKATLIRAGLNISGYMLLGRVKETIATQNKN